jgi:hypothetical protein
LQIVELQIANELGLKRITLQTSKLLGVHPPNKPTTNQPTHKNNFGKQKTKHKTPFKTG